MARRRRRTALPPNELRHRLDVDVDVDVEAAEADAAEPSRRAKRQARWPADEDN